MTAPIESVGLYIDGRLTDATSGETFDSVNPATGTVIASVSR